MTLIRNVPVRLTILLVFLLLLAASGSETASEPAEEQPQAPADIAPEPDEDEAAPAQSEAESEAETEPAQNEAANEAETEDIAVTNAVTVADQSLGTGNTVTVASVTSDTAGWLVIHAQVDGAPGPVLGTAAVSAGQNSDVVVELDAAGVTETLYAMLHVDAGIVGEYEFPGDDVPATDAAGNVVTPAFTVSGGLAVGPSVQLAESETLGDYLTDATGMTLYTFAADVPGTSNCSGRCAEAWPPLLVDGGAELASGDGIPDELGTTQREDGTFQVTYDGWPLYYWVGDAAPGDTNGHLVNNVWAVARATTHVFLGGNDDLGRFLTGPNGLTLYRFNPDEPGVSTCYEQCAAAWPPLLVQAGEIPYGHAGVVGELGTTERDDGTVQVTYQGMPLYYWAADSAPGDATGQAVGDVWFVVPAYTVRVGDTEELGSFLVDSNGMTLYLFTVDEENQSNCYGQCAATWPPLLVQAGEVPVPGVGVKGDSLGVVTRDDGTFQVVYEGNPLYFYARDQEPGETTGHQVNDVWFVVPPTD